MSTFLWMLLAKLRSPHTRALSGAVNLVAEVRDADSPDDPANYVSQPFTVTVVAPTLDPVAGQTTAVGVTDTFSLSASDPIGNGLIYRIVDPVTHLAAAHIVSASVDPLTGVVTLKPEAGFAGTINLSAEVRLAGSDDVLENYVTQTFSLTVLAPSLLTVSNQSTTLGAPKSITLSGIDFTGGNLAFTLFGTSSPTHITITPGTGGQFILQPDAGFTGTINLRAGVRAASSDDVAANYTTQDFTLTVSAPTLDPINNVITTVGVATSVTLTGTNPSGGGIVYSIVDPVTKLAPAHVAISINQVTGLATLTPEAGFGGTINLLARVRDVGSADVPENYVTQTFSLLADQVTVNPIRNVQVPGGKSVLIPLNGTDAAGNPLTYTASSSDSNVTVEIVSPTSKSMKLTVSGTDKNNQAFSGTLILHLFEDLTPTTAARIEDLVNQDFTPANSSSACWMGSWRKTTDPPARISPAKLFRR